MKNYLLLLICILITSCYKEELFGTDTRVNLWLSHYGAEMPIVVEGNTNSKVFICLVHGGPGSSAQLFNSFFTPFSDPLETDYAMVYWDQRNSGLSRGEWDPSKITIKQHIEDLDQMIQLLKFKFGADISIFLAGHSWGGYLTQAYLLDTERQTNIKAWININGLCHRNRNMKDALVKIEEVAREQVALDQFVEDWNSILQDVQIESDRNIQSYDNNSEDAVFSLIRRAETLIRKSDVLSYDQGSAFNSAYRDNTHPAILNANKRTISFLIPQMYNFDLQIDQELSKLTLPSLFLYGLYDVRTPSLQASYVIDAISTAETDKELVIFNNSEHSSIGNEPAKLVTEIKAWVERYK